MFCGPKRKQLGEPSQTCDMQNHDPKHQTVVNIFRNQRINQMQSGRNFLKILYTHGLTMDNSSIQFPETDKNVRPIEFSRQKMYKKYESQTSSKIAFVAS